MKLVTSRSARICFALLAATPASSAIGACASETNDAEPQESGATVPGQPAADGGATDADAADADACASDDCDFFPSECTPDVFCPTSAFDLHDPAQGLSWLTASRVLAGRSPSDVWFAGSLGAYSHFDGTSWSTVDASTQTSARAFWLTPSGEVAVTDSGALLVRGSSFVTTSGKSPGGFATAALANKPANFGRKVTAGFAPAGSTTMWIATNITLRRLGAMPDGTIAVQSGIEATRCIQGCERTRSIHGSSEKTVFAVGELGAAVRIDDADSDAPTLTPLNSGTTMGLWGVFAASDTDVWAAGGGGTIRH
ncbi:hypothetical protein AKJ09_03233 [Labilithrix luteola]|uniref:Uncharacterized protein n=1 Tax=Labilithrix luteola TaxID=1391654 RepID=A0A0K1PTW1_9BACT|nr:hypothetical protein [Labilithrix luteola]AKU96569.1 hypothetical protein AKJ09_03233 [Labilithrix luteola]